MEERKYRVTVDNQTVAENMTFEYAIILTKSIFETYYNCHEIVVEIAEMPKVIASNSFDEWIKEE